MLIQMRKNYPGLVRNHAKGRDFGSYSSDMNYGMVDVLHLLELLGNNSDTAKSASRAVKNCIAYCDTNMENAGGYDESDITLQLTPEQQANFVSGGYYILCKAKEEGYITTNEDPRADDMYLFIQSSKQLIDLDDYANMSVAAHCSYVIRDENGDLLDFFDWEKSGWMILLSSRVIFFCFDVPTGFQKTFSGSNIFALLT